MNNKNYLTLNLDEIRKSSARIPHPIDETPPTQWKPSKCLPKKDYWVPDQLEEIFRKEEPYIVETP